MMKSRVRLLFVPAGLALACLFAGCNELATEVAREAADRQARQNETMADLQEEVAAGTRRLVEAEAESRQQILGVHEHLQAERSRLQEWWERLRGEQRTESLLVPLVPLIGKVMLVALLLGFCWYALFASHHGDDAEGELNEVLLTELTADEPQFLGSQHRLPLSSEEPSDKEV